MVDIATINSTPQIASGISVKVIQANDQALKVAVDTLEGEVDGWRSKALEYDGTISGLPTYGYRGKYRYLSFPIWAIANEDLLLTTRVPFRWDGVTNPHLYFITAPTGDETIDDRYKFQLKWISGDVGATIPDTTTETLTCEVKLITGENTAFFGHILDFELDATTIVSGQNLQFELLRVAATADEVANEVALFHWDGRWKMNRLSTDSTSGY